jgi:hypothetical protein
MMKSLLSFGMFIILVTAVSCSKEDDQQVQPVSQSSSNVERITYSTHVQPLLRKACSASNCHNGISENNLSAGMIVGSVNSGSFQQRVFNQATLTPCGILDERSKAMLQSWIDTGTPLE